MKSDGFLIGLGKLMEDVPESTQMALGLISRSFRQSVMELGLWRCAAREGGAEEEEKGRKTSNAK